MKSNALEFRTKIEIYSANTYDCKTNPFKFIEVSEIYITDIDLNKNTLFTTAVYSPKTAYLFNKLKKIPLHAAGFFVLLYLE